MSIIQEKDDLERIYETVNELLAGIIYEPEESGDLVLVFQKHLINISEDGVVTCEER